MATKCSVFEYCTAGSTPHGNNHGSVVRYHLVFINARTGALGFSRLAGVRD
jgi:hypothetical protein